PLTLFFTAPATTALSTLSLHDALPIYRELHPKPRTRKCGRAAIGAVRAAQQRTRVPGGHAVLDLSRRATGRTTDDRALVAFKLADRKSTRLNSSHVAISYAVFCLKKKK